MLYGSYVVTAFRHGPCPSEPGIGSKDQTQDGEEVNTVTAMIAKVVAMTLAVTAIAVTMPGPAAAQACRYDYVCNAWGYCMYRW